MALSIELDESFTNINKTYIQTEKKDCNYCEIEVGIIDLTATPDVPLVPENNWVGIRCDRVQGKGAAVQDGDPGIMAFAHITNATWSEKVKGNDVVWYGTYTNREDLQSSVMEPDFHTLSMFHEEIEMDLSPFHIEFEGFAVAGIPDEWT